MVDGLNVTPGTGKTVATDELTDGTLGAGNFDVQFVKLMDGTLGGTNKVTVSAANALKVDGSAVTQGVSGTVTANPGNVANTTPWLMKPHDGTTAITIKPINTAPVAATDTAMVVTISPVGEVADGLTDTGTGNKISARAYAGVNGATMLTAAQRADLAAGVDRVLYVRPNCGLEDLTAGVVTTAITTTTTTSVVAAGGSGIKNYVTSISASNTSATATDLLIQDGSGGTTKWLLPVPATSGVIMNFATPLGGFTANTAIFVACVTTGASVKVAINGFKSKI